MDCISSLLFMAAISAAMSAISVGFLSADRVARRMAHYKVQLCDLLGCRLVILVNQILRPERLCFLPAIFPILHFLVELLSNFRLIIVTESFTCCVFLFGCPTFLLFRCNTKSVLKNFLYSFCMISNWIFSWKNSVLLFSIWLFNANDFCCNWYYTVKSIGDFFIDSCSFSK